MVHVSSSSITEKSSYKEDKQPIHTNTSRADDDVTVVTTEPAHVIVHHRQHDDVMMTSRTPRETGDDAMRRLQDQLPDKGSHTTRPGSVSTASIHIILRGLH